MKYLLLTVLIILPLSLINSCAKKSEMKKEIAIRLEPKEGNPRNSEGDFIQLKDGRILFIYSHFTEGSGDNAGAYLAGRYSSDGGKTWSDNDMAVVCNEGGMNVMSVSLLRLSENKIGLFYLRKNSEHDCIPYMRTSTDEALSWSEPVRCLPDSGYFVVNNDRLVRLKSDRLIYPTSQHINQNGVGLIRCYYSDDEGKTWQRSKDAANPDTATTQEPGVVELKDGRVMLLCRTESGVQYISYSADQGETWSDLKPGNIVSPLSPASIERIPQTGDLLLVWNNNYQNMYDGGQRTPFNLAISKDEGKTWEKIKAVESDPNGWYCYTAIQFVGDHVLLGHCAGDRTKHGGLETTQITRLNMPWVYGEATEKPVIKEDDKGLVTLECADKDAKIYYSLDRKMPDKLYKNTIKITRTTPLWVRAKAEDKTMSDLVKQYVGTQIPQPAIIENIPTGKGLICKYYEGVTPTVSGIKKLTLKRKNVVNKIDISGRERDTNIAFVFNGYINIPRKGHYTFYLGSNDGSVVYLDNHELINMDGPHGFYTDSIKVVLEKGKHKLDLQYFQMKGGLGLKLSWKGPGMKKQEIPQTVFSHSQEKS